MDHRIGLDALNDCSKKIKKNETKTCKEMRNKNVMQ